jgi:NADPH2:quinone reductase
MRAWRVHAYGKPRDVLHLEEVPRPDPGPGEIRIHVSAITLNYNDLDGILGRYRTVKPPLPFIPGMEVLGRVDAAGAGAESWLGKRVCAIPNGAFGGYAEWAIGAPAAAFEMPDELSDADAAALYFPYHLAWLGLFERGGLRANESVLIHAAAGGVGSAALQLAHHAGARVFATAGSDDKLALCRALGAEVAIDYRSGAFADLVNRETSGRGVDVIFDPVGGSVTTESMRCLAFNGRLLLVGFAAGIEAEDEATLTPRPLMFGNFSLMGVCHAYVDDPIAFRRETGFNFPSKTEGERVHREVLGLVKAGAVRPVVGQRHRFEALPAAFDAVVDRTSVGRSVVLLEGE